MTNTNDSNQTIGKLTSYIQPNVPVELAAEMLLAGGVIDSLSKSARAAWAWSGRRKI